jgi:selenocysteine lyase/cysteine desulfurase
MTRARCAALAVAPIDRLALVAYGSFAVETAGRIVTVDGEGRLVRPRPRRRARFIPHGAVRAGFVHYNDAEDARRLVEAVREGAGVRVSSASAETPA